MKEKAKAFNTIIGSMTFPVNPFITIIMIVDDLKSELNKDDEVFKKLDNIKNIANQHTDPSIDFEVRKKAFINLKADLIDATNELSKQDS